MTTIDDYRYLKNGRRCFVDGLDDGRVSGPVVLDAGGRHAGVQVVLGQELRQPLVFVVERGRRPGSADGDRLPGGERGRGLRHRRGPERVGRSASAAAGRRGR